jgi:hypothetical protein
MTDQTFFDENRTLFKGETSSLDLGELHKRCDHNWMRKSFSEIVCTKCSMGLIDNNKFILNEGHIQGSK